MRNLLAFDTGTEFMSVAVQRAHADANGVQQWQYQGEGGARSSTELIPCILDLLRQADLSLHQLDAICFGNGPGSFTGLRTACSVAQGLAFGANIPVLPVDSLLAVAEEARFTAFAATPKIHMTAVLDARMNEWYIAHYAFDAGLWTTLESAHLTPPTAVPDNAICAGNVAPVRIHALPTASALLRLAPQLLAQGHAVAAEHAAIGYVRNKVAQTTAERLAEKTHARTL